MRPAPGKAKLTVGPVGRHLLTLTVPMIVGLIAMISYGIADTYFVGQLGTLPLAAMSFTFPINFVATGLSLGIGTGTASVLARLMGSGDRSQVQRITTHAVLLAALLGLAFLLIGLATIDPLFRLLGADDQTMPLIHEYMEIYYLGGVFLVLPMVGNSAIRATGDAKVPGIIMGLAALFNIILDPILIFGLFGFPRLELRGAAIATVLANGGTFVAAFLILYVRERLVRVRYLSAKGLIDSWRRVLHVGVPAIATNMVTPMTAAIITALIAAYGPAAVAGFGVAVRVESLALIVIFALGAAIAPFVGQNFGAGELLRVRRSINLAAFFCLAYGLLISLVMWIVGRPIAALFDDNALVVDTAGAYFMIVAWTYGTLGVFQVCSTSFNSLGRPLPATALTFVKMFLVYVPSAYLLSQLLGVNGIFLANAGAHLLMGIAAYVWLLRVLGQLDRADDRAGPSDDQARRSPASA